jgi:hypothetical protein
MDRLALARTFTGVRCRDEPLLFPALSCRSAGWEAAGAGYGAKPYAFYGRRPMWYTEVLLMTDLDTSDAG